MRVQLNYEVNVRITDRHGWDRPPEVVLQDLADAAGHLAEAAEYIHRDRLTAAEERHNKRLGSDGVGNGHTVPPELPAAGEPPKVVPQ